MDADSLTLAKVFSESKRYHVPVYQRPYVWERDRQWKHLWNDVNSTATRLVLARVRAHTDGGDSATADQRASPHFLGAIVLRQTLSSIGQGEIRSVVDGQQRLATLQLMLRGVLDALDLVQSPKLKKQLRQLIWNDEDLYSGPALYKVWPRRHERDTYIEAMDSHGVPASVSPFYEARLFFRRRAQSFIGSPLRLDGEDLPDDPFGSGSPEERRASVLVDTIRGLLKLVAIELGDEDDAQVIFEALNARGTPLSSADLVKNVIFIHARKAGHNIDDLYDQWWERFDRDTDWWRGVTGSGHAARQRLDLLLGHWLVAQLGRVVNVDGLYEEFRIWSDRAEYDPVSTLESFSRYADAFECMHGRREGATTAERKAFAHIDRLNITAITPLVLWLMNQPADTVSVSDRQITIRALESFVVRRMAAKWQTRRYRQAFADVLSAAQQATGQVSSAIIEVLQSDQGVSGYTWPTDEDLIRNFQYTNYYGSISQLRLRMLLGEVDKRIGQENPKFESLQVNYGELQIDHIMPQDWKKTWPVPVEASDAYEQEVLEQKRQEHIHRIGNLTLVSKALNPAMRNAAWQMKRKAIDEHSGLRINKLVCREESWDEDRIVARGEWLARRVGLDWPGPSSPVWRG